jgi:hypothetical protein
MGEGETGQKGSGDLADREEKPGAGVYIYWKIPSSRGRNISRFHSREKICKGEEKKGENARQKGRKGKEEGKRRKLKVKGERKI